MDITDLFHNPNKENEQILYRKIDGVVSGVNDRLHGPVPNFSSILDMIESSRYDLGNLWDSLFTRNFKKWSSSYPKNNHLFCHVIRYSHDEAKVLTNYIVDNAPDEFLYQFKNLKYAPLVMAAEHDQNIALKVLARLDPTNLPQDRKMYHMALMEAHKSNFRELIDAIELKIAYQPPAIVTNGLLLSPVQVAVDLPDPRDAIEAAISSGRISDALRVDDEVLRACMKFFESFQNHYAQTLSHAEDARQARMALDQRIERLKAPIETLMDEVGYSPSTESIGKDLWFAVRKHVPWLDPRRSLEHGTIEISTATETALAKSYRLIDDCQGFAEAVPKVLADLQRLEGAFAEAVDTLDTQLQDDMTDAERVQKTQLRTIFADAKERSTIMSGTLAIQDIANPSILAAEIEFASSLKNAMVAFSASATTAINSMALIKIGMTDQMRAEINDSLCSQWDKAEATLNLLKKFGNAPALLGVTREAVAPNLLELH